MSSEAAAAADPSRQHNYTPEKLQRLMADCICHRSALKNIKLVIHAGGDPNGVVVKGLRPLHYAAYENYPEAASLLVSYGVEVNQADDNGYTPLHYAAKGGYTEVCKILLENGAICNFVEGDENSSVCSQKLSELSINPLNLAIEFDRPKCVQVLLQHGANPNTKYFLGYEINLIPPEHTECLKLLLKHGADPNLLHRGGLTILMKCCKIGCVEGVQMLIEHGADVNFACPSPFDQRTALHFAALTGNLEICKLLLDAGASTARLPTYATPALELAITQDKMEVCKMLLDYDANPNELNGERSSMLQVACTSIRTANLKPMLQLLLERGADPRFYSRYYSIEVPSLNPLLEYLSYQDDYDLSVVMMFLEYGANVNMTIPTKMYRIKDGGGVLHFMRKLRPYEEIFTTLVKAAKVFDIDAISVCSSLNNKQREILLEVGSIPRTLKHLCRLAVRDAISCPVKANIEKLQIPSLIKQYLLFATELVHIY